MKIRYKFLSGANVIRTNKTLSFIIFMALVLICSFALSYSLISSAQKKEDGEIANLTSEVERLKGEISQKDAQIADLNARLNGAK